MSIHRALGEAAAPAAPAETGIFKQPYDISAVEAKVSELLGFPVKVDLKPADRGEFRFEGPEIPPEKYGIFAAIFSKVYLYGTIALVSRDIEKFLHASVRLRWEHWSGGSNGAVLLTGSRIEGEDWKFITDKERQKFYEQKTGRF